MEIITLSKEKFLIGGALLLALFMVSCASFDTGKGPAPASIDCASDIRLEMETDKAQLTEFTCMIAPFRGEDVVWYAFEVKNVSTQPSRFIVRVIPEEGPAFSGLLPRTGEPKDFPVLGPGERQAAKYAMNTLDTIPPRLTVVVGEELR
ncbi:MAG: hypothetical protein R6T92_02795 [Desulfosalsimonadaceae bacterium]